MNGPSELDPSVSLDIRLRQSLGLTDGEVLEVDYENLRWSLYDTHAPSDNSDLTIVFEPWQDSGSAGDYDPEKVRARVEVSREFLDDSQHLLVHELKHYSDDMHEHRSMRRSTMYDKLYDLSPSDKQGVGTAALGLVALPLVLQVGAIVGAAPEMSVQAYERMTGALNIALGTNVTLAAGLLALNGVYVFDQSERRARKAADESTVPNVLTINSAELRQ